MATRIQSVERAAQILIYVADHPNTTASQIAGQFGLNGSTTHHLLSTLTQEGLLKKDRSRQYSLGRATERIAEQAIRNMRPRAKFRAALSRLAKLTGESCYLTSWRGDELPVVAVLEGEHAVRVTDFGIGYADNIHARVGARVLLAYADDKTVDWALADYAYTQITPHTASSRYELEQELQAIRDSGIARDREQLRLGVYSISAPLLFDGRVEAALSLTAPLERFLMNEDHYISSLRICAEEVAAYT